MTCHYNACTAPATHDTMVHRSEVLDERGRPTYDQKKGGRLITKPAKTRITPGGYLCHRHARIVADLSTEKEKRRG